MFPPCATLPRRYISLIILRAVMATVSCRQSIFRLLALALLLLPALLLFEAANLIRGHNVLIPIVDNLRARFFPHDSPFRFLHKPPCQDPRQYVPKSTMPRCATGLHRASTFIMLSFGFQGSTAVMSELASHEQVHLDVNNSLNALWAIDPDRAMQLTRSLFDQGTSKGLTTGFQISPKHILADPGKWAALAEEYNTRIIWQYRNEVFKDAVRMFDDRRHNETTVFDVLRGHLFNSRCVRGKCSFSVTDMDQLYRLLQKRLRIEALAMDAARIVARERQCVFRLLFGNYLYSREETMRDVKTFLGLSALETHPARFSIVTDNLCQAVENWDEVCQNFYGCSIWSPMMDDPRNGCYCKFIIGASTYCNVGF